MGDQDLQLREGLEGYHPIPPMTAHHILEKGISNRF